MEHNLKLIIEDEELFPDDDLKSDPSFGWQYYLARQLFGKLDFDLLPNVKPLARAEPLSFLVGQLDFLIKEKSVLGENENAIKRYKKALVDANAIFDANPKLRETKNQGLLAAITFYSISDPACVGSFVHWVLENNLHLIENTSVPDIISIFDQVLETRKHTIFVSMPFGNKTTENHYKIIERVAGEVSTKHGLKSPLKVERVDWFHDGTSYNINDKIVELMSDCGLLIANLTLCNPNVYHEIGFVMGKAKAEKTDSPSMLLFLDEGVTDPKDKYVGFNLAGIKQVRFQQSEDFGPALSENIEKFFKLA